MSQISNKIVVQQLLIRAKQHGMRKVVLSPGSRNAPLSISFSESKDFETFVIPDERSAAFYALGMAEALAEPVAVVCTSGSALLNYYPAVSEAFYRNIPLIVISADRPNEWIDQGDGQTIRQVGALSNHIIGETSLIETPTTENEIWYNYREIDRLFNLSSRSKGGPVHFNIPFNEPLYDTIEQSSVSESLYSSKKSTLLNTTSNFSITDFPELKSAISTAKKIMILCGQLPKNNALQNTLNVLVDFPSITVMVENTSNLSNKKFIHCIDRTINSITDENKEDYVPELLITIGGAIVSKKIKTFFRLNPPLYHWKVGESSISMDTFKSYPTHLPIDPVAFFKELLHNAALFKKSRFQEQWKQLDYLVQLSHSDFLSSAPYADLSVFDLLLDTIPENSNLHMGNSSVVRYCQLFDPIASIYYTANRGTSGIDGSLSTAVGHALAKKDQLHVCIIGDVSFFYDSNALWNHHLPSNLRIVLINNGGGGIFKIIPGPSSTNVLDEVFFTKQAFSAEYICKTFNVEYMKATSLTELETQLPEFYTYNETNRPILIEVFTHEEENGEVLKDYFKAIHQYNVPVLGD